MPISQTFRIKKIADFRSNLLSIFQKSSKLALSFFKSTDGQLLLDIVKLDTDFRSEFLETKVE
jgi:hypothetical protein